MAKKAEKGAGTKVSGKPKKRGGGKPSRTFPTVTPVTTNGRSHLGRNDRAQTIVDLLRNRASSDDCRKVAYTFLIDGEKEEDNITYLDLDFRAEALAARLQAAGLDGSRVLLVSDPGIAYIVALLGCMYAGAVPVPVYPPDGMRSQTLPRLQSIVADAQARAVVSTTPILEWANTIFRRLPNVEHIFASDQGFTAADADAYHKIDVTSDRLAFLQYTSGSTGEPKGVMLSHANLIHNLAYCYTLDHPGAVGVSWLPPYHDMGLIGGVLWPLFSGNRVVLLSPLSFVQRPARWLEAISRYHATTSASPNFGYELCARKVSAADKAKLDLSTWSMALNGAEPVRADTLRRFATAFRDCGLNPDVFFPVYGLAEATLMATCGQKGRKPVIREFRIDTLEEHGMAVPAEFDPAHARALVGCGATARDQQVLIVNPADQIRVDDGQVGEIWIAGPSVAQGYWGKEQETAEVFNGRIRGTDEGPFLRTGDLGFIDDGDLFVTGRVKDLIIIRGRNHYPHDIEQTVESCDSALKHGGGAAFSVDREGEERLIVVHEVLRPKKVNLASLLGIIEQRVLEAHAIRPATIVLITAGTLPKTSSGKTMRRECRKLFIEDRLNVLKVRDCNQPSYSAAHHPNQGASLVHNASHATTAPRHVANDIAQIIFDEVANIAPESGNGTLTLDSDLREFLDSIEYVELLERLEERFGGSFPEDDIAVTCRDVIRVVENNLGMPTHEGKARRSLADVPLEHYMFAHWPEVQGLERQLESLGQAGICNPFFNVHERVTNDTTVIGGKELINFASYNYLGMSGDPIVAKAAKEAIDRYGTSVSASRLVSGEKTIHRDLESAIARFVGTEDCIVYVGGHSTNESTIGHLFERGDLILHDALAHNSIIQGGLLSGARRRAFPHNDWQAVDRVLSQVRGTYRRVLIVIEGVYSMDGDIGNLRAFAEVRKRHKAILMVDEAHSIGVLGKHGRGAGEYWDVDAQDVDLWMGTLSKSLGSCGGYIAGSKHVVQYLKYTAPGFVYSVGISPANAAAALASIEQLLAEPERLETLRHRARLFLRLAKSRGLNTGMSSDSPIIPIILGDSICCMRLSAALRLHGINVQPIIHPAVEEREARLRFFITSSHSEEQIRYAVRTVAVELAKINGS